MRYLDLRQGLKDFPAFALADIRRIDNRFYRARLNEWQKKGYITKLIKGYYLFKDAKLDENTLFAVANKIYKPSYISFEMALSYYHLIPESVYGIASATTRKTYTFKTPVAEFSYRTLKPPLFFGYQLVELSGTVFKIATIEKAVLDYFYVNPGIKTEKDFPDIRFNAETFLEKVDENRLNQFLNKFAQNALSKRISKLTKFIKNA